MKKESNLQQVYDILRASTPLEMSQLYTKEDQKLMKAKKWDYDNPSLVVNIVKNLLEKIDPTTLTKDEAKWRQEVLWFWYHHAISCAISKNDKMAAQRYADKAVVLQKSNHPNKITLLLYNLVHDELEHAELHARTITKEPEKSTARDILVMYKEKGFWK